MNNTLKILKLILENERKLFFQAQKEGENDLDWKDEIRSLEKTILLVEEYQIRETAILELISRLQN